MNANNPSLSGLWGVAIPLLLWLGGCGTSEPPPVIRPAAVPVPLAADPEPAPRRQETLSRSGYAGSASCAECHADIAASYAQTTMGRSASTLSDAPVIERFDQPPVPAAHGFEYVAELTSAGMIHHERLRDRDGEILYDQAVPIACELGSGQRGRSYLILRDDQFVMSPLTWYSTVQRWDLSPGYTDRNHHFERRIVEACAQCHVGRMAWAANGLPDRVAHPEFLEASIGCERCHGPGQEHIAWRRENLAPDSTEAGRDPIVNPARLQPHLRESICNECHLLGVERVLRSGRQDRDFRPGDDLSDVWTIFTRNASVGVQAGAVDAVNQVPQMHASRCFIASNGELGCTSCHDPHRQPASTERLEFYRTRCLSCHAESTPCSLPREQRLLQTPEDSCIACHMPKLQASDVPHTSQTDHRILRRPLSRQPRNPSAAGAFTLFPGMESRVPRSEQQRARGLLMSRFARDLHDAALAAMAAEVLEPFSSLADDDPDYWQALGDAYAVQNLPDRAELAWQRALEINPNHELALRSLAISVHDSGRDSQAVALFERYRRTNQWDRVLLGREVHALGRLLRVAEARRLAEVAVQRFPWDYRLREWLAEASQSSGQKAEAEIHRRIAERLKPSP